MTQINIGHLFMDTVYADIVFVVDTKEIPGHRLVLATISAYFNKLLFGDFLESKSKKVNITEISAKVFKEVMRFVYKEQLEVEEWTIEDLMSLLSVAHEYQFQPLISAVIKAVKDKPLDFDSWPVVKYAASVYGSEELKRKSTLFAEEKIDDFVCERDLEKISRELICSMLECPSMSTFNQDHVVKAICNWRKGQSSSELSSVMQKIIWNKVSSDITALILQELFSTVKNLEEHRLWTKLSANIKGQTKDNELKDCILRVGSVVMRKGIDMKFELPENKGNFLCRLAHSIEFCFEKDGTWVEIPVERIEFEASRKFNVKRIHGCNLKGSYTSMIASKPTLTNGWYKYNVVISHAEPVYYIVVGSEDFENVPEISLRIIVIY